MTVLDSAVRPLTPGEVRDRLEPAGSISYSTVVTTLTRLFDKGAVARHRDGRAFRYGALSAPAGLVADRMSRLMEVEPDRATVLRRFVSNLSPDDERLLRELLEQDPPGD